MKQNHSSIMRQINGYFKIFISTSTSTESYLCCLRSQRQGNFESPQRQGLKESVTHPFLTGTEKLCQKEALLLKED